MTEIPNQQPDPDQMGETDNGRYLEVDLIGYQGGAGIRTHDNRMEVAWFGKMPRQIDKIERAGTVDGKAVRVVSVKESAFVRGMVVATVVEA